MDGIAEEHKNITLTGDRDLSEKSVSPWRNGPDMEQLEILNKFLSTFF